jgi:hypothetical protein
LTRAKVGDIQEKPYASNIDNTMTKYTRALAALTVMLCLAITADAGRQRSRPDLKYDGRGRISRSSAAVRKFKKLTGYPHGRPGYVIDHKVPLCEGGGDKIENMQWMTVGNHYRKHHLQSWSIRQ